MNAACIKLLSTALFFEQWQPLATAMSHRL